MHISELHSEAWSRLLARRAQLPHALLISGQRGLGKYDLARAFAESLLCERPSASGRACGECAACGWLAQGNHPDFRLLQPDALADDESEPAEASKTKKPSAQITIGQVRAIDDFLHVGTHRHGARVILVNPAEAMNRATANSLLKALEEPIANTLFLLVTSERDRLLPTIRSRCQALPVPPVAGQRAEHWLAQAGVRDPAHWLGVAGGLPLLAAELAAESGLMKAVIAELARGGTIDALAAAASLDRVVKAEKRPAPLKRLLDWAQKWLFDLTLCAEGLPARYFAAQQPLLQRLAQASATPDLLAFNRKALQYKIQCDQPLNSRLFLEEFFLGYAALFRTT